MIYIKDYVVVNIGLTSNINQDNIYCNGIYLNENNNGINNYKIKTSKLSNNIYAVFDGIGGLSNGQLASYISSNILSKSKDKNINDILNTINNNIIEYNKNNNTNIGTTASIVKISKSGIDISEVGDSPVFILHDNEVTKIVEHDSNDNMLNNYLGCNNLNIKNTNIKLRNKGKILICSDGLTKEVGINEIEYFLKHDNNLKYIGDKLVNFALKNGGKDNISIILIEYSKSYIEMVITILVSIMLAIGIILLIH